MAEERPSALPPLPEVQQEVRRLFREMIQQPWGGTATPAAEMWQPCCDMVETDAAIVVEIELPGMQREDVQVEVEGDTLRITGERRASQRHQGRNFYYVERQHGHFTRQLQLPHRVDRTTIQAEWSDGVLTITLPKRASR